MLDSAAAGRPDCRPMLGPLTDLLAATAAFVLGHFLLSAQPLRDELVGRLGERRFRGFYALFALAAFAWMLLAYRAAPWLALWSPPDWTRWLALALMLPACLLLVGGLTQRSPTLVGGERLAAEAPPARGFQSVTRHPFLVGTTLWALAHLAANGDAATAILAGGILLLSLGGMAHIDRRRARALGAAWGPIQLTTSRLPFLAVAQGRCRLDWAGIGWWRPLAGLALYALLIGAHPFVIGAPVLP